MKCFVRVFEVPDKCFDRLTWNVIFLSYRKGNFVLSFKFCMKYVGFSLFLYSDTLVIL